MENNLIRIRLRALANFFVLVLIFDCLVFLTQDHFSFNSLFIEQEKPTLHSVDPVGSIETIELAQTLQFFNDPETIFLDVREKKFYDYGHIERAENFPIDEIPSLSETELNKLKKAPVVVIYCNGLPCSSVYVAAKKLSEKGFNNIKIYVEGWPEWRSCHLPIAMSEQMKLDIQKEHF